VKETNRIVDREGTHEFPKFLLTNTETNYVLPALLESMVLTFADAPTKGKSAFNAYGALITYGMGGGLADRYLLPDVMTEFLLTGRRDLSPVDSTRVEKTTKDDYESRKAAILEYLDKYIRMLHEVEARPLSKTHWRNNTGAVLPTETLLMELMTDVLRGYVEVRTAVANHTVDADVDVS
jgi:hypothetical protein